MGNQSESRKCSKCSGLMVLAYEYNIDQNLILNTIVYKCYACSYAIPLKLYHDGGLYAFINSKRQLVN
jgi:hypothetical protein